MPEKHPAPNGDQAPGVGLRGLIIASPGGLSGGGGMGSVTRAMHTWLGQHRPAVTVAVVDPRGEGAALWWPAKLVGAVVQVAFVGLIRRPRIIHLQVSRRASFVRKGILMKLGRLLGMRTVVHHHGSEFISFFNEASPRMKAWVRQVVRQADVNVVLGEGARDFLVESVGLEPQSIVVLPNATGDILAHGSRLETADPWDLLIMANLSARKGVGTLLKAVAQLAEEGAPVKLTLAGGGEVERFKQEADALGIADRCHFTGWVSGDAVRSQFLSRGMLVLPSLHEGLPMAILEALSAGLPVVTTPVGSIPEVLEHEKTCLFVSPENVAQLAAAIRRLCEDDVLRQALIANGRALYDQRFEIGAYMTAMLSLYDDLLLGKRHAGPSRQ